MSERLARYKQTPRGTEQVGGVEADDYRAFVSESHAQNRLRIESASGINHMPAYAQLVDIMDIPGELNTRILLVFYNVVFRVEGRTLAELLSLLQDHKVKRIVEFNADAWQLPAAGQPIITRIRTYENVGTALAEGTKTEAKATA